LLHSGRQTHHDDCLAGFKKTGPYPINMAGRRLESDWNHLVCLLSARGVSVHLQAWIDVIWTTTPTLNPPSTLPQTGQRLLRLIPTAHSNSDVTSCLVPAHPPDASYYFPRLNYRCPLQALRILLLNERASVPTSSHRLPIAAPPPGHHTTCDLRPLRVPVASHPPASRHRHRLAE
jgi:hypothetical protein